MKNQIKTALKWLYGVSFIITGIIFAKYSIISGLSVFISGLILLPPTIRLIERKTEIRFNRFTKYITVILLFFVGIVAFSNSLLEKDEEEILAEEMRFLKLPKEEQEIILAKRETEDSIRAIETALNKELEEESRRKEEIVKQFSKWDGSHHGLTKYIKDNMNDPESFEHVKTEYWEFNDHLVVLTKFRGRNSFGGKVIDMIKAKVDLEGNVIEVIE